MSGQVHGAESTGAGPFYFGCWGDVGHYLRDTRGKGYTYQSSDKRWTAPMPFSADKIDGALTPRRDGRQGAAALHHRDGWTALAWNDYSVDHRGGSNSVVFLPGTLTFGEALDAGRAAFPSVFDRQPCAPFDVGYRQIRSEA